MDNTKLSSAQIIAATDLFFPDIYVLHNEGKAVYEMNEKEFDNFLFKYGTISDRAIIEIAQKGDFGKIKRILTHQYLPYEAEKCFLENKNKEMLEYCLVESIRGLHFETLKRIIKDGDQDLVRLWLETCDASLLNKQDKKLFYLFLMVRPIEEIISFMEYRSHFLNCTMFKSLLPQVQIRIAEQATNKQLEVFLRKSLIISPKAVKILADRADEKLMNIFWDNLKNRVSKKRFIKTLPPGAIQALCKSENAILNIHEEYALVVRCLSDEKFKKEKILESYLSQKRFLVPRAEAYFIEKSSTKDVLWYINLNKDCLFSEGLRCLLSRGIREEYEAIAPKLLKGKILLDLINK